MTIWRNLDPKLLADLLIQASESLKEHNVERRQRPFPTPRAETPVPSEAGERVDNQHV
ncbi:MAG: hypothetical protein U1E66_03540 [Rhodospirillales bacterium]